MKRKYIHVFVGFLFLLAGAIVSPVAEAQDSGGKSKKPNIIVFLVDDMGWQDTSVPFWYDGAGKPRPTFLNKRYKTPNMESLASQGTVFTSAYAQPVCSPSRVSMISGMNAARHRVTSWTLRRDTTTDGNSAAIVAPAWNVNGVQPEGTRKKGHTVLPLKEGEVDYEMKKPYVAVTPLPALLKKQGYTTIHCGKAHFGTRETPGANPLNFGFDYNIAGTEIGGPGDYRGSREYGKGPFHVRGLDENNYYQDDTFLTEALTQEALKRLDKVLANPEESKKPFYLYMAHYAIHAPFDQRGYDKRFADSYTDPKDGHPWSDNEKRYAGLIEGMDKSLGDIRSYLKRHGLEKNTVILFMSDNGGLAISGRMGGKWSNYPLSFGKGSCREGGIREPMIVCWPGVTKPGTRCDTPLIIEDYFPTLLEIAGDRNPRTVQKVDGRSFLPLIRGEKMAGDRPLLFHIPNIWAEGNGSNSNYSAGTAMRQGDWKLIYWHPDQRFELFNLKEDIGEEHNLAEQQPERLKAMAVTMTKLLKEREAQMPLYRKGNKTGAPEGSPVPWPDQAVARLGRK